MATEPDHAYCDTCPLYVKRDIAEASDLWTYLDGGWQCGYCMGYAQMSKKTDMK